MWLPTRPPLVEDVVVDLVEHPSRIITLRELRGLGEAGDTLVRWGALRPADPLTSIACDACGDDHFVELEFDPATRAWRYYCGSVGFIPVDVDQLVSYRFDLNWLMASLTGMLSIRRPETACLIDGVMWRLGTARLEEMFWTAILVREVNLQLDAVLDQLHVAGLHHPGLVLSSTDDVPRRMTLPNDYRWLPLRRLLHAESGRLEVRETAIRQALRSRKNRPASNAKPGPPSAAEHALRELRRRAATGEMHNTLAGEARYISGWLAQAPRSVARELGTIKNIIRTLHKELKPKSLRSTR